MTPRHLRLLLTIISLLFVLVGCQAGNMPATGSGPPEVKNPDSPPISSVDRLDETTDILEPLRDEFIRDANKNPLIPRVPFTGRVEHIFIHPPIPYPEVTFKKRDGLGFDDWFITVEELQRLLPVLYARGFVLVRMDDVYEEYIENGVSRMRRKELLLPVGKRPLILSIDDLNYYRYMIEAGLPHKLVIDDNGEVAALGIDPHGQEVVSRTTDVVPILDDFVKLHPGFSHKGAKGIIALTGYEGILGYRTHAKNPAHPEEREAVAPIVRRLKETGWTFASHSYGHPNMTTMSYGHLVSDTMLWKEEVEPLVGETNTLIYPFGARVQEGSDKFRFLLSQGFRVFCAVGPTSHERVSPLLSAVMTDRRAVDGITLRGRRHQDLYDATEIIDLASRPTR